jgi:hypothetical protein
MMSVSITELIWQTKLRGQTIQDFLVLLRSPPFQWGSGFLNHLLAVPIASTGCQQSLEIG